MSFVIAGNSASTGYNLTRSLRFRASASAYLSRTPASATNRTTYTLSAWIKRGSLGVGDCALFGAQTDANNRLFFRFEANDTLNLYFNVAGTAYDSATSMVFRDPSAWYHIVIAIDTTQATASNRIKVYVNGTQQTLGTYSAPPQNTNTQWNNTVAQYIGKKDSASNFFDGYIAELYSIDGQALTPSSFGSTNALTGVWQPAAYTGSYGTNGFYLPFTDNSALTTASNVGLGKDFSGNANYWATNNISITAGVTYDSMTDVPTLTSATAANYCTWNPLALGLDGTLTNGNLTIAYGSSATRTGTPASIGMTSGKYYWEITITASSASPCDGEIGISNTTENSTVTTGIGYYPGYTAKGWGYYGSDGTKVTNLVQTAYGASFTTNDVIGVAFDATAGSLTFYKNNTSQGVAFSGLPAATYYPAVGDGGGGSTITMMANFGQRPFSYTPPTGFVALNTYNLPDSTIVKGNTVMDATLYTGNSSTQTITNAGAFKPDFVWIKNRSTASQHVLTDSVRGITKQLFSSNTNAEQTSATGITALNSNGFSLGANVSPTGSTNSSPDSYVGWQWLESASAGFDIVTFTGNGGGQTFAHNLGVAPGLMICKSLNNAQDWYVYHSSIGGTGALSLNTTAATATSVSYWSNVTPGSSTFSVGGNFSSGYTYVNYLFAPIAGFSAFGSYTGNGSADGVFVYTGFRPKFVMWKNITDYGSPYPYASWGIIDSSAMPYNAAAQGTQLWANNSAAQGYRGNGSSADTQPGNIDLLSNGFKFRTSYIEDNAASTNYIYIAFAENPFKNSLAR